MFEAEAKERQKAIASQRESEKRGATKEIIPELVADKGTQARDKAAAAVGVNPRYVSDVNFRMTVYDKEHVTILFRRAEAGIH